jgi:hypothetical protein
MNRRRQRRRTFPAFLLEARVFGIYRLKRYNLPGDFQAVMFIHMFAFRWKPSVTEEQKQCVITEIRKLQGQIPGLVETSVGVNVSPRSQGYELGGMMKFTDQAALDAYGPHPVHQKLLSWLIPLIDPIEVDFEDDI